MTAYPPEALSKAVAAVCPDIRLRIESSSIPDERHLWWELSCCILSSQVPYPLAMAAADEVDRQELLHNPDVPQHQVLNRLVNLLSAPLQVDGKSRRYRFPRARAEQLALTRQAVYSSSSCLGELITGFSDAKDARAWLVANARGVGPKQASMFLRNCGITYDMAILDRHVLKYMVAQGLHSNIETPISGLSQYGRHEEKLRSHARDMDCPVGLLDWAIWIVMRVANKKQEAILA